MLEKDIIHGGFVLRADATKLRKEKGKLHFDWRILFKNPFHIESISSKLRNAFSTSNWGQILSPNVEQTLPRFPRDLPPTDGIWSVVNGTRFKFLVYSAYYDDRDGKLIRIIGATKTRGAEKVWCRFWYRTNTSSSNRQRYYSASVVARVKVNQTNIFYIKLYIHIKHILN